MEMSLDETLDFVTKRFHQSWLATIDEAQSPNLKEVISNVFKQNLTYIDDWLQKQFERKQSKNSSISKTHRQQGNSFYSKKNVEKSLEHYTTSLCYAVPLSEEYSLALANRSAVLFEMEKYEDCIKDIDLSLSSNLPQHLILKILLRKMESLLRLGRKEEFEELLSSEQIKICLSKAQDKNKYAEKIEHLETIQFREVQTRKNKKFVPNFIPEISSFEKKANSEFAYATSYIEIRYNLEKGRYVVAKENIPCGSILFVEKAFAFSSIFHPETRNFPTEKCYFCLKDIVNGIPCNSCTKCIYCDEKCKIESWDESHKWECYGMGTDMWYHLGIALPAFRTLMIGINSDFEEQSSDIDFMENKCYFGNISNNYPYVNSLLYHYRENDIETLVCVVTVWKYLLKYTAFFSWLQSKPLLKDKSLQELEFHIVYFLAKHVLQLENNSSIIEHWIAEKNDELPVQKKPVGCGLFPSVSMMNHSCKPNITNYFIDDMIIVKALDDIKKGEEIFNCYGIDYRYMSREERQNYCLKLYKFKCDCVICADPSQEMEHFDTLICTKCGQYNLENIKKCSKCLKNLDVDELLKINEDTEQILQREDENELLHCLHIKKKLLSKNHRDLQEIYFKLYKIYLKRTNMEQALKYLEIWLNNEQVRIGKNALEFGRLLHETARKIKSVIKENEPLRKKADDMLKQSEIILKLYFPERYIKSLNFPE